MKTKELIKHLQTADPSSELECVVGWEDILFVEQLPGYYDGPYQVLDRDKSKEPYYNVVGAKITDKGFKIKIHTHSIDNALLDNWELPVEYELHNQKSIDEYKKEIENLRIEYRILEEDIEIEKQNLQLGDNVKLSFGFKYNGGWDGDDWDHIQKFGDCVGIVERIIEPGEEDYGCLVGCLAVQWPEGITVRYSKTNLIKVEKNNG